MARTKGPGRRAAKPEPKKSVVSIRGTDAWREWLMGLAAHRRLRATDVIDHALIEYAAKYGYNEPAPPR
jgi:hypothetical protein